jgi:PAS domain S-box-containing protein
MAEGSKPQDAPLQRAGDEVEERVRERTAQLFASQQLLRGLVESSDAAIITKTLGGIITSWNSAAEKLFGFSAVEVIGQSMQVLIPPERADEEQEILERIGRGERIDQFETVRVTKSGRRVDISATISPIHDGRGQVIGASKIARASTERKRAEQAVHESEALYRTLFETMIEGFCTIEMIFDADGKPADYRFLEINPAFAERTGLHDAQGKLMRDLAPNHEAHWFEIYGKVAVTGEPVHFENEARALGRYYDVRAWRVGGAQSRKVGILFNDITARKQADARLHSQLARMELMQGITRAVGERQDLSSIFQIVIRTLEDQLPLDFGCICLYDHATQRLTVTRVGQRSQDLAMEMALTEQSSVAVDENGLSQCVRGSLVYEPDASLVPFSFARQLTAGGLRAFVAAPLLIEGKLFGILVGGRGEPGSFSSGECEFLRQLSEHVALAAHHAQLYGALQSAYEDLRLTQAAILQQERLKALGQMASGIAHDINNALSPVALYTESLLERESQLSEQGRGSLEVIQRAVHDVAATVARMREFYRHREPQLTLTRVDLNQLVPQVVELTRVRWSDMPQQRGVVINLQTELTADLPAIMGVENEIRDALTNLIFNAIDAMPEDGTLTLRSRARQADGVSVEVSDTGLGMDEATRTRCLEPFFTTKGERGTGLGLAMVYGVMQRHSGDIEIESALGRGTTIRLNFTAAPAVVPPSTPAPSADPVPKNLRILVVDDDPLLLKSLYDTLMGDGHTIVTADGGQQGIDAFAAALATQETFDVVVTDLGMPYLDGRQVASFVKGASPCTPVILLTGWGQRLIADNDTPQGVDRVLSKPPKLRELREALKQCLDARAS